MNHKINVTTCNQGCSYTHIGLDEDLPLLGSPRVSGGARERRPQEGDLGIVQRRKGANVAQGKRRIHGTGSGPLIYPLNIIMFG